MRHLTHSPSRSCCLYALLMYWVVAGIQPASAQDPIVHTRQGWIRGLSENGIAVFKSIPYAQPPIGYLRYQPPTPHQPWTDTLNTTRFSQSALQLYGGSVTGSEDCLYLNLYTPSTDNHKRPVVIWVHGGSMTAGTGKTMDGHAFTDRDDIVSVTINYRLGAFGFLYLGALGPKYHQTGDLGLLDVIAALRWVHDNIAAFGGDPARVTVMGESAGAKLLSAVMVAPASKGLFQQAILESGAVQCIRDTVTAKNVCALLLHQLGLRPDQANQLLTLPADTLMKAQAKVCTGIGGNSFFGPVYDGVTIPEDAYQYARERKLSGTRVLIGTNEQEGAGFAGKKGMYPDPNGPIFEPLFRSNAPMANAYYQAQLRIDSPYVALVKTLTQYMYQLHSYRFAKVLSEAGTPVYMYRYRYQNGRELGARHGDELHYIWGAARIATSNDDTAKKQLARTLHGAWVAFIRTGDPNGEMLPHWPGYSDEDRRVMVFDGVDTVERLKEVYDDKGFPSAVFVIK